MDTNYRTQIRKELRKTGCRVIFTSAAKLKNILCNNKSKLLPNSYPGVYDLSCDCGGGRGGEYIGETVIHCKDCHGRFNWLHPKTLAKLSNIHKRKIRGSLGINILETKAEYDKSIKVLNRD